MKFKDILPERNQRILLVFPTKIIVAKFIGLMAVNENKETAFWQTTGVYVFLSGREKIFFKHSDLMKLEWVYESDIRNQIKFKNETERND
jgi:hypothetical protein